MQYVWYKINFYSLFPWSPDLTLLIEVYLLTQENTHGRKITQRKWTGSPRFKLRYIIVTVTIISEFWYVFAPLQCWFAFPYASLCKLLNACSELTQSSYKSRAASSTAWALWGFFTKRWYSTEVMLCAIAGVQVSVLTGSPTYSE